MPLEVKTGRPSFSAEHKGQITLYAMMMSQLGREVDSGLLLYLRLVLSECKTMKQGIGVILTRYGIPPE
jgi:CRISPR/Cas system-associated exonuclease Cas4 (RecB family)